MKKNSTHIEILLDRSGSMASVHVATVDAFNEFIQSQKKVKGACTVSLHQFDDVFETLYTNVSLRKVPKLTTDVFVPRGMTALYDSLAQVICVFDEYLASLAEAKKPNKKIVVILTDGFENASYGWDRYRLSEVVRRRQEDGWTFVFLGANQDAVLSAQSIGIHAGNALNYRSTDKGTRAATRILDQTLCAFRSDETKTCSSGLFSHLNNDAGEA